MPRDSAKPASQPDDGTTSIPGVSGDTTSIPGVESKTGPVEGGQTTSIPGTPASPPSGSRPSPPSGSHPTGSQARRRGAFQPTFEPGEHVAGRYTIVRFVAQGGMGEVYEAEDLELKERVALKTVKPEIAEQEGAIERFKREIHLSRKVTHPNVCRIFDLGHHRLAAEQPGEPETDVTFLTMELLEGETLTARIKAKGKLTPEETLPIVRQMAAALATAHEAGIVHRDFKSSNVVLVASAKGDRAVVTDFGLAHAVALEKGEASLTGSGHIVGTPAYMAPEQVMGGKTGPEADIYALGVVMYEMITGRWPFVGESPLMTAAKRLKEKPPSPRSVVADLDPTWEAVILRCLERQPADRFRGATDVVRALGGEEVAVGRRTRLLTSAGVTAAILLALLAGALLSRGRAPGPEGGRGAAAKARRSVAVLGFKNLGKPEAAWLSTAISEMLRTELAAGGQIRTIPGENVARMKVELSLADSDSLAKDTLSQVRTNIGADLVALGSYLSIGKGRIRLDLRLQDAVAGEVVASTAETGTEDELFDLVSKSGAKLRASLGVGEVSEKDAGGVKAALPASGEARKLYSEGLAKLRLFDALAARELLEKAVAADPSHPLAHSALAAAWSALGYDEKAKAEAKKAFDLAKDLSREDRLSVEGFLRETNGEWDKAVEIYRGLLVFFPDNLEYGLRLGSAQTSAGRGQDALAAVDALRKLPSPSSTDPRIDLAEAAAAKALADFQRQQKAASKAASKARTQGASLLVAQARLSECTALVYTASFDEAKKACEEARNLFTAGGDRAGSARAENALAIRLAKGGELAEAKRRFEESLKAFKQIGDKRGVAMQLGNLGNIFIGLERAGDAKKMYQASLDGYREIGDKEGAGRQLNNLGTLYWETGDLEAARKMFEDALRLFEASGESRNVAAALNNIGHVLYKQGRSEIARERFESALKISRPIGDKGLVAETLTHLAKLSDDGGDLGGAQKQLEEALSLYRAAGEKEGEAGVLRLLGDLLQRRGDKGGGQKLVDQALKIENQLAAEKK